jgi:cytochrome c oxidase assembly factor CtaG
LALTLIASAFVLAPDVAAAHGTAGQDGWTLSFSITLPLAALLLIYSCGLARLWTRAGWGRGVRPWQAACFALGWGLLVVALVSPLHELGQQLFTAHMIEHEILMIAAAPLLVVSRPLGAMLWALPQEATRIVAAAARWRLTGLCWRGLTEPASASILHGAAIWVWHLPLLFDAALRSEPLHWLQHFSFLTSALLFWWALLNGRQRRRSYGAAVFYLFFTSLHCGLLGLLLAFARTPLFAGQDSAAAARGLTALEDQQLGGFIMWMPAGGAYMCAALIMAGFWINRSASPRTTGTAALR